MYEDLRIKLKSRERLERSRDDRGDSDEILTIEGSFLKSLMVAL